MFLKKLRDSFRQVFCSKSISAADYQCLAFLLSGDPFLRTDRQGWDVSRLDHHP